MRVRIYTWGGDPVAELDSPNTKRSWVLNNYGKCVFDMSISSPKTREEILRFGNLVFINDDNTPDWVGVIDTPRNWSKGFLTVTAYSAEYLLKYRKTPISTETGTAGALFSKILGYANQTGGTLITSGVVFSDNVQREETLGDDCLKHIKRISERSENDFDVVGSLTANGSLQLKGNWYKKKGITTEVTITDNDVEWNDTVSEQGDIYNIVDGYGDASTNGTRLVSSARNEPSISLYGARSKNVVFWGNTTQGTLDKNVAAYLAISRRPKKKYNLYVRGNIVSSIVLGNIYSLKLASAGFLSNRLGTSEDIRILAMDYQDDTQKMRLILEAQ